ncbi:hypothetical protein IGS74_04575 [Aureimonas sp. OT7]|uniref:hypothetical protein n=1 Tax=Aureimonas sp. OT7 TaxID=2816454 RepID=UPI0017875613|nr:hypothetical protein [Aureimonas sp. OT7]QOG07514.1 hypothetical protein IGS74_04575 [Aureimonas sp. OT7]
MHFVFDPATVGYGHLVRVRSKLAQVLSYRLAIADRYRKAAKLVIDRQASEFEHMEPVGFLIAMAAEITLKAFLSDRGWSDKKLKKLGHDLRAILRSAVDAGLLLTSSEARCILTMRDAHFSHFNRYGLDAVDGHLKLGAVQLSNERMSLRFVGALIDRLTGKSASASLAAWHSIEAERLVSPQLLEELDGIVEIEREGIRALNSAYERR